MGLLEGGAMTTRAACWPLPFGVGFPGQVLCQGLHFLVAQLDASYAFARVAARAQETLAFTALFRRTTRANHIVPALSAGNWRDDGRILEIERIGFGHIGSPLANKHAGGLPKLSSRQRALCQG